MPRILPRPSFEESFGEAVDRGTADDEGKPAVERQHRQRHDERRNAELAHQNAVQQAEEETEPQPDAGGKKRVLSSYGDLRDDDADQRHHAADGEIDISSDQQR